MLLSHNVSPYSSNYDVQMANMILNAGHCIVYCAPYYPVDGPIHFISNIIQGHLMSNIYLVSNNGASLCQQTNVNIAGITDFVSYNNCGYHRVYNIPYIEIHVNSNETTFECCQ